MVNTPDTAAHATHHDGDEPASTLWVTYYEVLNGGDRVHVMVASESLLERRGANRSHHLHVPDVDEARRLFGAHVVDRLVDYALVVNKAWWHLDLDAWQFKVLRYRPGHWAPGHVDMYPGSMRRKLTLIVQLTDPAAYTGGDLEVLDRGNQWHTMVRTAGAGVTFPAWTHHRVTPIETGERWTLAVWGYGPPVR